LPKENWSFPQLIHALRSAAGRHFQERDNAALRGNLLTMARRVSHDLRTPLGGVIATVDMLAEITPGGPAAVKPLFSSVDEITAIISRTSFLLKAIAQPAAAVPVNMAGSVREAQLRLERQITRRQATIRTAASWPVVSAVESWLEVIWWNLLQNSLKHAGDQPVIELSWESIEGGHRFWIRDNGPGVPAAAQERLFQSFHTLHDPNGPRGFGLAIVRGLVELMGGTCGREPQPPTGGAGFYFTLQETI
jgi:signal transduction histidine kinase